MFKPEDQILVRADGRKGIVLNTSDGVIRVDIDGDICLLPESELQMFIPERPDLMERMRIRYAQKEKEDISWEERERINAEIRAFPLDVRGHDPWLTHQFERGREWQRLESYGAYLAGKPVETTFYGECPNCGRSLKAIVENKTIHFGDRCVYEFGFPLTNFEINVPSGFLVVENDLRDYFPLTEDPRHSVNTKVGCHETTVAYAKVGLAHGCVGNTCPPVRKVRGGYAIGAGKGKKLASICTDLWWYSICDLDELKRRIPEGEELPSDLTTIKVKPGVYLFSHDQNSRSEDDPTYATFRWVRPPDPVADFKGAYGDIDINAFAYVQASAARWPTLYAGVSDRDDFVSWGAMSESAKLEAWRSVANHIFCVIGGGTDWHEKGFPIANADSSIPDVNPPPFRQRYSWYPFSETYGGMYQQKVYAPSFAKLLFRVLESVISFGFEPHEGNTCRYVEAARKQMRQALKRLRELTAQYPELADPEYTTWIGTERADQYVEAFDLGPEQTEKQRQYAESLKWIGDAYALEFDAISARSDHFSNGSHWAHKETASSFAILYNDKGFWTVRADRAAPLKFVARIVKSGIIFGDESIVQIEFDYGSDWMRGAEQKGVYENRDMVAIRLLTREEYEAALKEAT